MDLIDFVEARPAGLHTLRLPSFWVNKPVSWFVLAESRFRLHGINREQTRYDYLVSALTKEAVSLVLDLVEHPPRSGSCTYTALKQSLLDSHQLTDYQQIAALHKMELCPRGHETSIFFTHLFHHQNVRALAKKADSLWSLHGMKSSFASAVASLVDVDEPSPVARSPPPVRTVGAVEATVVAVVSAVLLGEEASSLAVSKGPASLKLRPRYFPRRWPAFRAASVSITSTTARRLTRAHPHATGKLACRGLVNTVSPGSLVHVVDQLSRRRFLVDTGASFSVYPHSSASPPDGPALAGAASQPIPCWGENSFSCPSTARCSTGLSLGCSPIPHPWGGFFAPLWPPGGSSW
jgi:hypothetical protein